MDSMRSLNTSLPRASAAGKPSSEVLQAFKSAALSITQLYKSASADADNARAVGYQECLDELLTFLDAENMGLGDGEGWRVRRWATERLSGGFGNEGDTMDEEEKSSRKEGSPADSLNTEGTGTATRGVVYSSEQQPSPSTTSIPPGPPQQNTTAPQLVPQQGHQHHHQQQQHPEVFHFRAQNATHPSESSTSSSPEDLAQDSSIFGNHNQIHLQVLPRAGRTSRQNFGSSKDRTPSIALGNLGHGAGSKRKHNLADFFDFSDLIPKDGFGGPGGGAGGSGEGRGGVGGGKKGRFI